MARENRFGGSFRAAFRCATFVAGCGHALVLIIGITTLVLSGPAHALTIRVPADSPTIQAGLDAASSGDTVLVAAGTYTGSGNRDLDFTGNDVVLLSETGAETTIIDAEATSQDPHVGCQFSQGESPAARVEGFTITRAYGGGAVCTNGSSPTFVHCIFTRCEGGDGGGARVTGASPAFTDCDFVLNTPATGGGVDLSASQSAFVRCKFAQNGTDSYGGALVGDASNVTFTECVFDRNVAADLGDVWGGGLAVFGSSATLEDCFFTANDAHSADEGVARGGAIYVSEATLTVRRCTFQGNFADIGGAIALEGSSASAEIDESIFRQNSADQGGAIACELGTTTITSCTLFDNAGNAGANGVFASAGSALTLTQVLIAIGSSGAGVACSSPGDVKITCSDIFGNPGGDWVGCIASELGKNGNIAADPLFCHTDMGDLAIANDSPCSPSQSACGLIGAVGPGCQTAVKPTTWGAIKASFGGMERAKSK